MKLSPLAEATMWLPGFAPDSVQTPKEEVQARRAAFSVIDGGKPLSIARKPRPATPPKAVWPPLDASVFDGLSGDVARYEANIAAVKLLRNLETDGRNPTQDERITLNQFTGWGALPKVFKAYHTEPAWKDRAAALKDLLDPAEYEAARASTPNAHYTSHEVVSAMWDAVERMGFKGGRILEPSAGAGYFIGAMPKKVAERSTVTTVELEPTSSRISKSLYGHYGVRTINEGFEAAKLPEGFFDLVISNVPFGAHQVPETRNVEFRDFNIHDYFLAKALEVVRPGGIVACITTSGTMDKSSQTVREYLASKAELLGAIRLPNTAFKAIANTSVTTDILFFKKLESGAGSELPVWAQRVVPVPSNDPIRHENSRHISMQVNPYFTENTQWIIGKLGVASNGYGMAMSAIFDGDLAQALAERVEKLPGSVYAPRESGVVDVEPRQIMVAAAEWVKPGAYVLTDGKLAVSHGETLEIVEGSMQKSMVERVMNLLPVRDAARKLVAAQSVTEDDGKLAAYRACLLANYEAFIKKHGYISAKMNQRAFRDDPDFPLLLSLEHWDEETKTAKKADIFVRRTVGVQKAVERCETPEEALLVCLAEKAKVVPARIAELVESQEDAVMESLRESGAVFYDPARESWVDRSEYLSGNVRIKQMQAETAMLPDNIKALEAIVPVDLLPGEISARLGVNWIPVDDYTDFCKEHVAPLAHQAATVSYNQTASTWVVRGFGHGIEVTQKWGTSRVNAWALMELAMNQQTPKVSDKDPSDPDGKKRIVNTEETVAAREKQNALKEAFVEWLWSDKERSDRLCRAYNDEFNSIVPRKYDGSHLTLPGFSMAYNLHQHQKDVIWRGVASQGNTLMAHAVGAGKTLSMICIGMEMRRIGMASKPCFMVPNHMLEQFAAEFLRAYPSASVLVASKEDMAPARRKLLLSRMATGDWDAVVITHSSFEKVPLPREFVRNHIREMIMDREREMRAMSEEGNTRLVKQLERAKKMWEARLTKLAEGSGKDDLLDFAEVGFDALFVDEAHLFKNLYRFTRMQMPGLPTNDSMRAFDIYLKSRYVMDRRGEERGVIFATGTPIANSVAEMWVQQLYLQPRLLKAMGLENFDAWATNFGEAVTALELAPDGSSYRLHTRFARFVNVPELMSLFREVADIRCAESLDLDVPEALREIVAAKASPALKDYVAELVQRAEDIRNRVVSDPRVDNMLKVTTDGRKAATDMRLIEGGQDTPGSKINLCVDNVLQIWKDTKPTKGTQLVFLDMGTPGKGWSLYDDIRTKLCDNGIPRDEVAFIHEYNTDKAKEALFKSVREGTVRIMIGSTSKMGMGTNVQTRLAALHHVDGPWRPADVEQREGRIVRQGNLNKTVRILRYVTEGSFDAYVWQTLETKARFIAQVMMGDTSVRSIEDAELAALSYAEVKALASGNPMVIEKAGVDADVMRLTMVKSKWREQQLSNRREVAGLPDRVRYGKTLLAEVEADQGKVVDTRADLFRMELDGDLYVDRESAGKRVLGAFASIRQGREKQLGKIGGFTIELEGPRGLLDTPTLYLSGASTYEVTNHANSAMGVIRMIEHAQATCVAGERERLQARVERDSARLEQLQAMIDQPFEHADKLDGLLVRKAVIDRELGVHEGDNSSVDTPEVAIAA